MIILVLFQILRVSQLIPSTFAGVALLADDSQEELGSHFETPERWESAYVSVLDQQRFTRDLGGDSQLLELRRASGGPPFEIHLRQDTGTPITVSIKTKDNQVTVTETLSSCHWTGELQGGGSAALSSCSRPNAYSGVFVTEEGAWIIQPDVLADNANEGIPHLILPPQESIRMMSPSGIDVRQVPIAKLEKAARTAAQERLKRRSKRAENATADKKIVELALFTDESLYKRLKSKFPNDPITGLKDYVTTMVNTMDLLYGQNSLEVPIGFRLVHLEVMKAVPSELETNGGKAKAYLSSFCKYAGDQNTDSAKWDHALLLTGLDLHEEGLKSTAGLAWAGTMCYKYYSCSVAEGFTFGSAFIMTHEIGHSLGMEHDGVGVAEGCDKDKFIMSATTGAGKIHWSKCSGKNLKDFIELGSAQLRGKADGLDSRPTCLYELTASAKSTTESLPGSKYDSYSQCALALGQNFKPYFQRDKAPFNNICWVLYCGNGTHAVSTHPALEGTKCDKNKYCKEGECVEK